MRGTGVLGKGGENVKGHTSVQTRKKVPHPVKNQIFRKSYYLHHLPVIIDKKVRQRQWWLKVILLFFFRFDENPHCTSSGL